MVARMRLPQLRLGHREDRVVSDGIPDGLEGEGLNVCNQGRIYFDTDMDGINDAFILTDNADTPEPNDPVCFKVFPAPPNSGFAEFP